VRKSIRDEELARTGGEAFGHSSGQDKVGRKSLKDDEWEPSGGEAFGTSKSQSKMGRKNMREEGGEEFGRSNGHNKIGRKSLKDDVDVSQDQISEKDGDDKSDDEEYTRNKSRSSSYENSGKKNNKKAKEKKSNKNFDVLFGTDTYGRSDPEENNNNVLKYANRGKKSNNEEDNYKRENNNPLYNSSEPFGDLKMKIQNKSEKEKFQEDEKKKVLDPYSCQYCEEVYRIIIFQNMPVKVFKCYYCHNSLNQTSLDFYYKKFEPEIKRVGNELSKSVVLRPKERNVKVENGGAQNEEPTRQKRERTEDYENPKYKTMKSAEEKPKIVERNDALVSTKSTEADSSPKIEKKKTKERKEFKIEEQEIVEKQIPIEKVEEPKPAKSSKPKGKPVMKKPIEPETIPEETFTNQPKPVKTQEVTPNKEVDKVVGFDKKWVDWNLQTNAEKIENYRKQKELIEINVNEADDVKNATLAEAFKKKKRALVKKFENKAEVRIEPYNNNNTTVAVETTIDKSGSNNNTKNVENDNTTIGEILNDSELRPIKTNASIKEKKSRLEKIKEKPENVNIKGSTLPNEPSPELLDRLVYGKKAEIGEKEMKDVNKRLYTKLIENKQKVKEAEAERKRVEVAKNKERLKNYSESVKNNALKKETGKLSEFLFLI